MGEVEFSDFVDRLDIKRIVKNSIYYFDSELQKKNIQRKETSQTEIPELLKQDVSFLNAVAKNTGHDPKVRIEIKKDFDERAEEYQISGSISTYTPEDHFSFEISFRRREYKPRALVERVRLRLGYLTD